MMTIKVRKSLRDVAIALATEMADNAISVNLPQMLGDEYVAFSPDQNTDFGREFWSEWDRSDHPFGRDRWTALLWEKFPETVHTSKSSVHRGAELEALGVAVLDCDSFAVVCRQVVDDPVYGAWHWQPVCVVSDPS